VKNYKAVRLAALAYWSMTPLDRETPSFAYLMNHLDSCLLKMPKTPASAGSDSLTEAQQLVTDALSDGYVPMTYEMRSGEKTVAWYRGPFTAVQLQVNSDILPFFSPEAALIYDQKTGMFDASYAAAWQLGRLLALSDRSFAIGMLRWRQQQKVEMREFLGYKNSSDEVLNLLEMPKEELQLLPAEELQTRIKNVFGEKLAGLFHTEAAQALPPIMVRDRTGVLHRKEQLPGVLTPTELMEAVTNEQSFFAALHSKIFEE